MGLLIFIDDSVNNLTDKVFHLTNNNKKFNIIHKIISFTKYIIKDNMLATKTEFKICILTIIEKGVRIANINIDTHGNGR